MARCRGRFVCPVILYKGKHICRSATLAGWGELYGRTGYNYIFSGGSDDAWADTDDLSEEDPAFRNADSQLFDKVRGHDIKLLRYLSVRYICDLMVENKKVKFGLNVTSSEKVDKAQRYADFTLLSIPYPGCEFFKEYKDRDYTAEGLVFNWKQDYVDAPLSIPISLTQALNIDWSEYQSWDLVQQTQNYLRLLISLINSDDDSGLLVHCISGWDRTPLFISLLRLSLWADGLIHASLEPAEILYLTVAYDWFLFGHMLADRLSKGEEIFFFCFNFLKHITSLEFSAAPPPRRKSLPPGFTLEEICMLQQRDRGSTTSLSSDFSLGVESSPGVVGSFTYEAVELMPAGAQAQAAWKKNRSSSPHAALWSRAQLSEDGPAAMGSLEAKSSSSSSSNHSDHFLRIGSSPLEVPRPRSVDCSLPGSSVSTDFGSWQLVSGCGSIQEQAVLSADASLPCSLLDELPSSCLLGPSKDRAARLEEVRAAFLAAYSRTLGLRSAAPGPAGTGAPPRPQFGRTEVIDNTLNPDFVRKFVLDYYFEEKQNLRFDVYNVDSRSCNIYKHKDFLGQAFVALGEVIGSRRGRLEKALTGVPGKKCGTIVVLAEELSNCRDVVTMQLCANKLDKKDFFGKSDPFLVFYRSNEDGTFTICHKTEVVKNTLNPVWQPFTIPVRALCNGDYDRTVKIDVYDWDRDGSHDFIGEFATSYRELSRAQSQFTVYEVRPRAPSSSCRHGAGRQAGGLAGVEACGGPGLDSPPHRTQLNFTVAIDFTASNGIPSQPTSLHYMSPYQLSAYAMALKAVGEIIQDYDSDKLFPAYGFGAKVPPDGRISHQFPLNNNPEDPNCVGIEGVLEAYFQSLRTVQLYGPTNFAPVINQVAR
ncbi:PREDICTED: myotubularin-related protein 14, partial [Gavialis gangeticus]|uniref:myotubularin-related protein 14 n=1 Tax=Gavialis gangeticus TaxID=94835 RepID=UPI00092FBE3D